MTISERKLRLARRILRSDDERFLSEIEKIEKKYISVFEIESSNSLTIEEMVQRIQQSEREIDEGNFHDVNDLLNQYQ